MLKRIKDIVRGRPRAMHDRGAWHAYRGVRAVQRAGARAGLPIPGRYSPPSEWDVIHVESADLVAARPGVERRAVSDLPSVEVDRAGRLIALDALPSSGSSARHRVRVVRRDPKWADLRDELYGLTQLAPQGVYQALLHPDLDYFTTHRKDDRWEMISRALPVKSGRVLDLGANLGYFSTRFSKLGFECTAVESNFMYIDFIKRLREPRGAHYRVTGESMFALQPGPVDIVLALSLFHHFLRTHELFDQLKGFLRRLDARYAFFEPHQTGQGFHGSAIDLSEEEFVAFVCEHGRFSNTERLGVSSRGRPVFLLSQ